jgi:hypothetical protein
MNKKFAGKSIKDKSRTSIAARIRVTMPALRSSFILHPSSFILLLILLLSSFGSGTLAQGGRQSKRRAQPARSHETAKPVEPEMVEHAMAAVCAEREADPQGSIPIDEMQARPSLPLTHPEVVAGTRRAERLLPVARELAIDALMQLAGEYGLAAFRVRAATLRIRAVKTIEPDMDLRDNAAVVLSDPRTISFGTIFLAGLKSDEGMVSVLAHELIHIGDGSNSSLRPLYRLVGQRAASMTGLSIYGNRPEELTCDLIGAMSARALVTRTPNAESLPRRLARSVEHNCVEEDDTDEDHLSPRNTMRAVFALDPALARDIMNRDLLILPLEESRPSLQNPLDN